MKKDIKTLKVKDLIIELQKFDPELDVLGSYSYTNHYCGDTYCYCTSETHVLSICGVDKFKLKVLDSKNFKKEDVGIVLSLNEI